MATFKPQRGKAANLDNAPFQDGQFLFTTDDGKVYIDVIVDGNSQRVCLNPISPSDRTTNDTQEVRLGSDGKLYTVASEASSIEIVRW